MFNCWSKWAWEIFQEKLQPFLQKSSMFSFGAMDLRTLSHLVFWEQKENKRPECMVIKMLTASHSFLLSNHRNTKQTTNMVSITGIFLLLWNNVVDEGGALSLALVWEAPWCWILIGVRAGGAEKWLISQDACVLWSLEETPSFRCWGLCESGPTCGPMCCDSEALCVYCMFPQRFPSYTAQVNCELSKHFSSPLHTGYNYLILSSTQPFLKFC